MYNTQKEKNKAIENKTIELIKQQETASFGLSSVLSDTEKIKIERNKLLIEKEMIINQIKNKQKDLEFIKREELCSKKRVDELNNQYGTIMDIHENRKNELKLNIVSLENKKKDIEENIVLKEGLLDILKNRSEKIQKDNEILLKDKSKLILELEKLNKEKEHFYNQKKEIVDLICKHGKILSETEYNLSKISLYVRRIQKFCNEKGIVMDLLKEFNIK